MVPMLQCQACNTRSVSTPRATRPRPSEFSINREHSLLNYLRNCIGSDRLAVGSKALCYLRPVRWTQDWRNLHCPPLFWIIPAHASPPLPWRPAFGMHRLHYLQFEIFVLKD